MADRVVESSGMKEFNSDLERNIKKLERLYNAANKASDSIDKLSESYNRLQDLANEPINFRIKGNQSSGSNKSGSKRASGGKSSTGKKENKDSNSFDKASKGIKESKEFFNIITDFGTSMKKGNISGVASAASKGLGLMGGAIGTAAIATGGITAALVVLSKVTLDAHKKTTSYAQSLRAMGVELSEFDKQNIETSKQMRDLGNRFNNVTQAIGEGLYPVLGGLLDLLDLITGGISSAESKDKIAGAQSNISTSAQQSGFSLSSANNLAGNTYKVAQQIADKTSEQASDVAKKLADAWLNGSDAAKEYGVVVNDQVLTGYMASKGVDIVNVEITDAMKQYYRYQLMMEELNSSNRDSMQDMIKEWTQLGFIIDKTKGKLFSFDEVIQLTAADPTIPDVSGSGLVTPDNTDKPEIPPVVTPPGSNGANPQVEVGVNVEGIKKVEQLSAMLETLPGLVPVNVPISVPVAVPGLELLPQLQGYIEKLPGYVPVPVPVTVPGLSLVPQLIGYLGQLPYEQPVYVPVSVPGMELLPQLYEQLVTVAQKWSSTVSVSVAGMAALTQAKSVLQTVVGLLGQLGQVKATSKTVISNRKVNAPSFSMSTSSAAQTVSSYSTKTETSSPELTTAKKMASQNDLDWNTMAYSLQSQYKTVAKEVNSNPILTVADGAEMLKNYQSTGKASSSKVDWMNTTGTDIANYAPGVMGALLFTGAGLATGGISAVASAGANALKTAGSTLAGIGSQLSSGVAGALALGPACADGGIGTKEVHNATLFEDNKKEAIIPLETNAGIKYLSDALVQAQSLNGGSGGGDIIVNLTLSGLNIANEGDWEQVGEKIAEVIEIKRMRRGDLNYGSAF